MDAVYLRRFCADEIHNAPVHGSSDQCVPFCRCQNRLQDCDVRENMASREQSISQSVSQ